MWQPRGFLQNRFNEHELRKISVLGALCGMISYVPFSFIYPLLLGPKTVDPLWERVALALYSSIGLILPRFPQTRPWIQAFVYSLCFLFTGHLFFLVCRNDLHIAYQMGYLCMIALIAFYLDTNFIFFLYVVFNYVMLGLSLLFKVSYENLFFGMIISTVLGIDWVALLSRIRVMKSLEESRAEVMRAAAALQEKNRKIQSIMENIQQGILTIDGVDGHIGAERSTYLQNLLALEQPGEVQHLRSILARTQLSSDQVEQVLSAVACIIQENDIAFESNYHLFPRSLMEGKGEQIRYLELDWNPIYDTSTGLVVNLLVCIRDVTELQRLRLNAARGQQELSLLAELVSIPWDRRHTVLKASQDLLLSVANTQDNSLTAILRMVHTLKGNARTFGLSTLAQAAHECETQLQEGLVSRSAALEPLRILLQHYQDIVEQKLGHQLQDDMISLPRAQIAAAVTALGPLAPEQRGPMQSLYETMHAALCVTFQQILGPQLESLPQLAAELGKPAPFVHLVDPGVYLRAETSELIRGVFVHLFRNALDHGLEEASTREKAQKSARGHIWLVIKPRTQGLDILFHDDGQGLHLAAIEQKARDRKLMPESSPRTPQEIAELIFHPGFSTKSQVTDISGRGVGLDAVRHMMEEAGGSIGLTLDEVQGQDHVRCIFVLHLPQRYVA
jgi:two-component system chemotaxis sensor kinase CheA